MFRDSYNIVGPLDKVVRQIDPNAIIAYVPGCPPKPEAMILGVVKALGTL
jgi:NADH:ubiquinone oxidoreductase subunit B-like Fe-S oxidoreductase